MTIKGGTNKACAACKYQRRRCSKECPLSPYFPADKPKRFSNAHRLFGVCNIMRILNQVEPNERDEAMRSIIFESDIRAKYPVLGCYGVILRYQCLALKAFEELRYVKMLLALYKQHSQQQYLHYRMPPSPTDQCSVLSQQLLFGIPTNSDDELSIYNHLQHDNGEVSWFDGNVIYDGGAYIEYEDNFMKTWFASQQTFCNGITNNVDELPIYNHLQRNDGEVSSFDGNKVYDGGAYIESEDNLMKIAPQQTCCNGITNVNADAMDAKSNLMAVQGLSCKEELGIPADYDDTPFHEIADDRQSFVKGKDACESSAESSVEDPTKDIEHVLKNELKSAACFLLTSVKG